MSIAEAETWSRFYTQTWYEYIDYFPAWVSLRVQPVQSITAVTYTDYNGDSQTLSTDVYELGEENGCGIVRLKFGQSWPATRAHPDVIRIETIVGYGDADDCPVEIKHVLLMLCTSLATEKGDTAKSVSMPAAARELLSQRTFRVW